jgi:hypothetical protein
MTIRKLEPWVLSQLAECEESQGNDYNYLRSTQSSQNDESTNSSQGELRTYSVSLSRTETATVEVIARSEEDARSIAYELDSEGHLSYYDGDGSEIYDVYEESRRQVSREDIQTILNYDQTIYMNALGISDVEKYLYGQNQNQETDQ